MNSPVVDYVHKQAYISGSAIITLLSTAVFNNMTTLVLLCGYSSAIKYFFEAKLYFVPCISPSGAVGLYDLMSDEFYGNAGSGAFTAGPSV